LTWQRLDDSREAEEATFSLFHEHATQPLSPSPIIGAWNSFLHVGVFLAVFPVLGTAFLAVRKRTGIATSKAIRAGRRKAKQKRRDFGKHSTGRAIFRSAHETAETVRLLDENSLSGKR
jgi:hypothetical protein